MKFSLSRVLSVVLVIVLLLSLVMINDLPIVVLGKGRQARGTPSSKANLAYDSGWINITDECGQYFNVTDNLNTSLNTSGIMVEIQGKTTVDGRIRRYQGLDTVQTGWNGTYGVGFSPLVDFCSMIKTADGGYAICYTWGTQYETRAVLVKTDSMGQIQWSRSYQNYGTGEGFSVIQTTDGGYAIAGSDGQVWLIKTDPFGVPLWNKTLGVGDGYSLVQTMDGGYVIAGMDKNTYLGTTAGSHLYLVKTNSNGDELWNRTYGGSGSSSGYSLVQTRYGELVVAGWTNNSDYYLVKTDSSGKMLWNKTYGRTVPYEGESLAQTSDGGFILAGNGFANLIKTDNNGNIEWTKSYGVTVSSVFQTRDEGYVMAGSYSVYVNFSEFVEWSERAILLKTDSTGTLQWNDTYNLFGPIYGENWGDSAVQANDGSYILAGFDGGPFAENPTLFMVNTGLEFGIRLAGSTPNTITLYRGTTDPYWNFVRVRIWIIKNPPQRNLPSPHKGARPTVGRYHEQCRNNI